MQQQTTKILIVARWPLGGIRTYMRYMFSHFPAEFRLTVVAASTQEDQALKNDVVGYKAQLVLVQAKETTHFTKAIFKELSSAKYDLIISQGFISAVAAHFANITARVPHMITVHGIVEPHYLKGRFSVLKRMALKHVLKNATVLYGVSNDILEHVYNEFPGLRGKTRPQPLVILNGIEPADFNQIPENPVNLRAEIGADADTFLFGFFGRFMPQKGFDLIIEAVDLLHQKQPDRKFAVVAVGSGDYIREYQIAIQKKQLEPFFYFLSFQPMVHHLYLQVNTVLMPSRWEACPLLPMEVLCMGVPLIASNCIGTREMIVNTPAFVIEAENVSHLLQKMCNCFEALSLSGFIEYSPHARLRFDVANSAKELIEFITRLLGSR